MDSFISSLNHYSGLIALIAAVLTLISIIATICIFIYEKKIRKKELQAELDSINSAYYNPITRHMGFPEKTQMDVRKDTLERELGKK